MKKLIFAIVGLVGLVAGLSWATNGPQPAVGLYWYDNTDPTAGAGMTAPLNQLLIRTDTPSIYYKSGSSNTSWTKIGTGTGGGGGGTVTSVACGTGMSCAPSPITTTGTVSINLTPTSCSAGMAETATASDGTSTCNTFFNTAGTGLTSSGSTVSANLAGASCAAGTAVTSISSAGAGTCTAVGTVTSSTLTANTIVKATGASAIGNSLLTDNATTFAVNSTMFTVTEANGNTAVAGTFNSTGTTTLGDATHDTSTGRDLTIGRNLISTAGTTTVGQTAQTIISPSAITGTVNDWAPTGLSGATAIIATLSAGTTLNGLTGGVAGRQMCINNSSGSNLSIANGAAGSAAANRFATVTGATWTVASTEWVCFLYDGAASLWRQVATSHLAVLTVAGTTNLGALNSAATTVSGTLSMTGATAHFKSTGSAPSLGGTCGTGAAIAGTDVAGRVTTGTGGTSCTITFAATFTNAPSCVLFTEGSATPPTCTISATAITCTTTVAATTYDYQCVGLI